LFHFEISASETRYARRCNDPLTVVAKNFAVAVVLLMYKTSGLEVKTLFGYIEASYRRCCF
jgi:hypothetical protein